MIEHTSSENYKSLPFVIKGNKSHIWLIIISGLCLTCFIGYTIYVVGELPLMLILLFLLGIWLVYFGTKAMANKDVLLKVTERGLEYYDRQNIIKWPYIMYITQTTHAIKLGLSPFIRLRSDSDKLVNETDFVGFYPERSTVVNLAPQQLHSLTYSSFTTLLRNIASPFQKSDSSIFFTWVMDVDAQELEFVLKHHLKIEQNKPPEILPDIHIINQHLEADAKKYKQAQNEYNQL